MVCNTKHFTLLESVGNFCWPPRAAVDDFAADTAGGLLAVIEARLELGVLWCSLAQAKKDQEELLEVKIEEEELEEEHKYATAQDQNLQKNNTHSREVFR